jgi:hypothetical protein
MIALYGSVDLARHGRIAVVTVDNPPANALSHRAQGPEGRQGASQGDSNATSVPSTRSWS